ncbi:MAG: helix-turn-helix domain-containing protein [Candidatus Tantalella remota]|nr:helix-turn-helix domain-containing protein [Candidatus Tantalella remota]
MAGFVMTVDELADYLKMKTVTIYKHAQEGKIPAFKVGSKWRFKKETIDDWIEDQERGNVRHYI